MEKEKAFDIALIQKPEEGLTLDEVTKLFGLLNDKRGIPCDLANKNGTSFACGFIAEKAFEKDGIEDAVQKITKILDDLKLENKSGEYHVGRITIRMDYD